MRMFFFIFIGFLVLVGLATSTYSPSVKYLEASNVPFRVKPANVWTKNVPNSEHQDKCIFTNYECAEQYKSVIEDLGNDCCEIKL